MVVVLIIFGLLSGIIGGMGMGGGTLLIPLLTIFLSFSQLSSQGINLLCFLPMSVVAIIIHTKNKMIKYKCVLFPILCGIVFCVFGSYLATIVGKEILKKLFGIFLINLSLFEFIKLWKN